MSVKLIFLIIFNRDYCFYEIFMYLWALKVIQCPKFQVLLCRRAENIIKYQFINTQTT